MLTKEKIDKQLAGQTSSNPFMNLRDSQSKKVSFKVYNDLEQKIDRLTVMMHKLVTEDNGSSKPFKPQIYQPSRGRNQNRGNFHGRFRNNAYRGLIPYNQNFRDRYRSNSNRRGISVIIPEVVRDTVIITMIIEETITEVKVMIGIEVDH